MVTIDLEERIRRAAQLLDDEAFRARDPLRPPESARRTVAGRWVAQVAAACLLMTTVVGLFWVATRESAPATGDSPAVGPPATAEAAVAVTSVPVDTSPPTTVPTVGVVPPLATLPEFADVSSVVPATVLATRPTQWYRLQPDLDVAWYSDGGDTSMLCFRTPAGEECQLDRFAPTTLGGGPIGVRSADDQLLVVTLDPASSVAVTFDDGRTLTPPVERDAQVGWGVARIQMPPGARPDGLAMMFEIWPGNSTVPATAPPTSEPTPSTVG